MNEVIDVPAEKRHLDDFHQSLQNLSILVIEGNTSTENLLYKELAPDDTRGIVSIGIGLRRLGLRHIIVPSDSLNLQAFIADADLVMIYAHGEYGEDGRLQGWLDYIGKPYTGPGVFASAVCLDKLTFKRLLASAGLDTPKFSELFEDSASATANAVKTRVSLDG